MITEQKSEQKGKMKYNNKSSYSFENPNKT